MMAEDMKRMHLSCNLNSKPGMREQMRIVLIVRRIMKYIRHTPQIFLQAHPGSDVEVFHVELVHWYEMYPARLKPFASLDLFFNADAELNLTGKEEWRVLL